MQFVIKHSGRFDLALKDYPVSDEQMIVWKEDKVFWPLLNAWITKLAESRGLTPEYVKSFLFSTLEGKIEPNDNQMKAINNTIRALGLGLAERKGFNGAITISPSNTQIVFEDGLDRK